MEAILRCENEVHVDALTVVDFTMLYVTYYMSDGKTIRKVMGGGGVGQKEKKFPSNQAQEHKNPASYVIVRVNTLLNIIGYRFCHLRPPA